MNRRHWLILQTDTEDKSERLRQAHDVRGMMVMSERYAMREVSRTRRCLLPESALVGMKVVIGWLICYAIHNTRLMPLRPAVYLRAVLYHINITYAAI